MSGMANNCCASNTRCPRPSVEPMNISATTTITSAQENAERDGDRSRDQRCEDRALQRPHEIEAEPATGHPIPQRTERVDWRRQQHAIHDLIPHRQIPDDDQPDDADDRKVRIETPHPLRTSRWNTSRQCALMRMKSCCDSVASVRGRAAS